VKFEWDPAKAVRNLELHEVSFQQASTVFGDPLAATVPDPAHSAEEARLITMGHSASGSLLVVVHTEREDRIRIISARAATRAERKKYEEGEGKGR
jgi:uncharacterized DUF497 family protein